jgi:hypothetical protein
MVEEVWRGVGEGFEVGFVDFCDGASGEDEEAPGAEVVGLPGGNGGALDHGVKDTPGAGDAVQFKDGECGVEVRVERQEVLPIRCGNIL